MSNIQKGKYGEDLAVDYLKKNRYKIIDRNYKYSKYGEIDIIALDRDGALCFVEVKTRTGEKFGSAFEAITKDKLYKIYACVKKYISICPIEFKSYRIDAISVMLENEKPVVEHIKNIEF